MTSRRSALVSVVGAAIAVVLGMVTVVSATPADDKRAEASRIATKRAELVQTAERLNEESKASEEALTTLNADLTQTSLQLSQRTNDLGILAAKQSEFALKSYVYGQSTANDLVGLVAGTTDVNEAGVRDGYTGSLIGNSSDAIDEINATRQDIAGLAKSLVAKQHEQTDIGKRLAVSKAEIAATQLELDALAKKVDAELSVLVEEEAARQEQERLAQEKRAADQEAARQAARTTTPPARQAAPTGSRKPAASNASPTSTVTTPRPTPANTTPANTTPSTAAAKPGKTTPVQKPAATAKPAAKPAPPPTSVANYPAPSARAATAISAAKSQLGKPYVFGTNGPDTYDCSGLTQWAWAKAGVSMSHYTVSQYDEFPHVPLNALQPGDLVFFKIDLGHMGMYIGGGMVIHAPQTGDVVKISPLSNFNVVGASRPG
jgi:peptidoglycan DL-endopeptidase CwlO